MLKIVQGNLLDAKEKYIAHITNCVSTGRAMGIAKDIFDKYPYADCYSDRIEHSKPGTIDIRGDGENNRFIINMHAIVYPGKSRYPDSNLDGLVAREKYFYHCLLRIAKIKNLESIAFNWMIGCGLASGNWNTYIGNLNIFSNFIEEAQGAKAALYRKEI